MSLSTAFSTAMTGLTATSRAASVASDNIANALTEGFARREIELGARQVGKGVSVMGVDRVVDKAALQDLRQVSAETGALGERIDFLDTVTRAMGVPGDGTGLTDLVADFEAALVDAAAQPQSLPALSGAVDAADRLTDRINGASAAVQDARGRADKAIGTAVASLQADLERVADLNDDIRRATLGGDLPNALLDARQTTIDRISDLVPVREIDRGNGVVALLSEGGLLLDGNPVSLEFSPAAAVGPQSDVASGALSQVSVNGTPVDTARDKHILSGGRLQALFDVRDVDGPAVQTSLDALALDLSTRFAPVDADAAGVGLFTDAGLAVSAAAPPGLAGRLSVNTAVIADAGGAAWRLRDGLSASAPGLEGNAGLLRAHADALSTVATPASPTLGVSARDGHGVFSDAVSALTVTRDGMETHLVHASAREAALTERMGADGVDTDTEMQALLLIERSYAANARVISTAGRMIDTLLEI